MKILNILTVACMARMARMARMALSFCDNFFLSFARIFMALNVFVAFC